MTEITPSYADQIQTQLTTAEGVLQTATTESQALINELNRYYTDANGRPLNLTTLAEWKNALQSGTLYRAGLNFGIGHTSREQFLERLKPALAKLDTAQASVADLRDTLSSLTAMMKLLKDGDIEGAVVLLQTTRVKVLDTQLKQRVGAMQERNAKIQVVSQQYAAAQKEAINNPNDGSKAQAAAQAKGQLDALNSESQLDMIGIQSLTSKRNEAFETLSNLISKLAKVNDTLVRNI